MKYGRLRTLRGQLSVSGGVGRKEIIVSDGLINLGLKILSLAVWSEDNPTGASAQRFTGILSLDTISSGANMNAGDNRQFAWTFGSVLATAQLHAVRTIIDPDHIVNRDLFLTMDNSSTGIYNYLIEAQVVELTDDEAIVTIIKETSQS